MSLTNIDVYTFTLSSVYGILDVAICHLAGLVLPHFLRSKLGYLGFLEEAVENLVAQLFRALGKLIEVLQCIEPLLVERIQFFQGFVELGNLYINIFEFLYYGPREETVLCNFAIMDL